MKNVIGAFIQKKNIHHTSEVIMFFLSVQTTLHNELHYIWIYYTTIALLISAKHSIRSTGRHLTTTLSTNSKIKPRAKLLNSMLNQNHGCVSESFT